MTAIIIIGCVLLFLLLIMLLRVGVILTFAGGQLCLKATIGFAKITVIPRKNKPKKPKKQKPEVTEEKQAEKAKTPVMELVKRFVPPALDALGRFRRKVLVNRLTVYYTVASTNPVTTAMTYGRVTAIVGSALPVLDRVLNIRDKDVVTAFSFERAEPEIYVDVKVTIAIWQILYVATAMLPALKTAGTDKDGSGQKNNNYGKVRDDGQAANK